MEGCKIWNETELAELIKDLFEIDDIDDLSLDIYYKNGRGHPIIVERGMDSKGKLYARVDNGEVEIV